MCSGDDVGSTTVVSSVAVLLGTNPNLAKMVLISIFFEVLISGRKPMFLAIRRVSRCISSKAFLLAFRAFGFRPLVAGDRLTDRTGETDRSEGADSVGSCSFSVRVSAARLAERA